MNTEELWLLKEKYLGEKTDGFFADCERLKQGEPIAYLIGHIPFLGANIYLDSHPLIPRTETEFWVNEAIKEMQHRTGTLRVLDLCAGSGCIGAAVLHSLPLASVDFIEMNTAHHQTIQKNIIENSIDPSRTNIIGGDVFERVTEQYDFILTNPPYIDEKLGRTDAGVLAYEPHDALFGGNLGMEIIAAILKGAPEHLTENGIMYLEHEPEQCGAIHALARESKLSTETHPDQYGVLRYTRLARADTEMMAS